MSDENGRFHFRNVTPGEYDVEIWPEKIGAVKDVDLGNAKFSWTTKGYKLRLEKDGDLGRIALVARLFDTD